jgi:Kef-type K+ transport system membrane component KefB
MKKLLASIVTFFPSLTFAQQLNNINDAAQKATNLGNLVVQLAISLAVIWIIINVIRYLIAGGEEGRKKGGFAILYGVVALFVILSIWGLVYLLKNSFTFGRNTQPTEINNIIKAPTVIVPN